jgi:hypothetical protein
VNALLLEPAIGEEMRNSYELSDIGFVNLNEYLQDGENQVDAERV